MSFCSSPERKTIFLPGSGFGALLGPSHVVCGPAYFATAALASATASAKAGEIVNAPRIAPSAAAVTSGLLTRAFIGLPPCLARSHALRRSVAALLLRDLRNDGFGGGLMLFLPYERR